MEVYGITGNQSRFKQELGWRDVLATDSYDLMIYAILKRGFEGVDGIDFCGFQANELRQASLPESVQMQYALTYVQKDRSDKRFGDRSPQTALRLDR